jgi:UDP-2,4-diacetamido-2,4,6-trideoxy-beta-L-altropyranose hydrolase
MKNLVIRADASSEIGIGHVMRCLALAQGWQESGGTVSFIMRCSLKTLDQRLSDYPIDAIHIDPAIPANSNLDAIFCADIAIKTGASWVVIDGYQFDTKYLKKLKGTGLNTLVIDDNGLVGHHADIILNQNAYAKTSMYGEISRNCQLLMGPKYALIRKEFREFETSERIIPKNAKKILITLGGGDSSNITGLVLKGIELMPPEAGLEIKVILGDTNPHRAQITEIISGSHHHTELLTNVTNMAPLIAWADIGISSGGSTNLEFAFFGLPGITIPFAQNQITNCDTLHEMGITINMGWYESVNHEQIRNTLSTLCGDYMRRQSMNNKGKMIVDGNGVRRIVNILMEDYDA